MHPFDPEARPHLVGLTEDSARAWTGSRWVERILKALRVSARTGRIGDGKVFVWPVEEAVRICTGEREERAIRSSSSEETENGDEATNLLIHAQESKVR